MVSPEKIELPILTPEEAWLDKVECRGKIPDKIKRLIYLPAIACKAAVYAHEKNLSKNQKEMLLLSFRTEADEAQEIISEQVSLTVGNSPSDRISYLKDFQNWQKQLIELLQKALNCISEETWLKKFIVLATDNKTLLYEDKQEWCKRFKEIALLKVKGKVFDKVLYWNKFSEFTYEALKLIQLGAAMIEITMERSEWIIQAMKNTGYLPANQKYKKTPVINNELQKKIEEVVSGESKGLIAELKTILKEASKINLASDKAGAKKPKKWTGETMALYKTDRDELKKYADALNLFVKRVNLNKRNVPALLTGPLPPMDVELLFARIKRQDKTAGQQLKESYKQLIDAAGDKKFSLKNPKELVALFPSSESIGKIKYEANLLAALMQEIAKAGGTKKTTKKLKPLLKNKFSFGSGQAFFNGKDLGLPTGETIEILQKLVRSMGKVVEHKVLESMSTDSNASDILKGRILTINKALKHHNIRYKIESRRGVGYVLQQTKAV